MHTCVDKIRVLRNAFPEIDIQVDGGISEENIECVAIAGANVPNDQDLIYFR